MKYEVRSGKIKEEGEEEGKKRGRYEVKRSKGRVEGKWLK